MEGYTGVPRVPRYEEDPRKERPSHRLPPTACEQCGKTGEELKRYRLNTTDRGEGTASFHISMRWLCQECAPKRRQRKEHVKSEAELKALLRKARRSLR